MEKLEKYLERKIEILDQIEQGKSWNEVVNSLAHGESLSFIYAVEDKYKTKVNSKEELIRLIGIKDKKIIDNIIDEVKEESYFLALQDCWDSGGKYKDLIKLSPKDYAIGGVESKELDKEKQLRTFIGINYNFLEKASIFRPELRVIAKDLGAPYSLILKTYLEF